MDSTQAQQFRSAVERHDRSAIAESFADEFVLLSPATSRPFKGRILGSGLVHAARGVLEDFHYTDIIETEHCAVLVFEAHIGDVDAQGIDLIRFDGQGMVRQLEVMIRPLPAARAFADAMGVPVSRLLQEQKKHPS